MFKINKNSYLGSRYRTHVGLSQFLGWCNWLGYGSGELILLIRNGTSEQKHLSSSHQASTSRKHASSKSKKNG